MGMALQKANKGQTPLQIEPTPLQCVRAGTELQQAVQSSPEMFRTTI